MARKPRIEFPGALYHILTRGNNKQPIFVDDKDRITFLNKLGSYKQELGFNLYAYILMINHIHLLIETSEVPLSKIMQCLLTSFTQYFNRRHKRVGHLFQGRYKAILCDKNSYLLELVRYIHLNPIRAKLVDDLRKYKWSSHPIFIGETETSFVKSDFILEIIGGINSYRTFINEGLGQGHREDLYQLKEQRILGDEIFVSKVTEKESLMDANTKKINITLDKLLHQIAQIHDVPAVEIAGRSRSYKASHARGTLIYTAVHYGGYRNQELQKFLKRDFPYITYWLKKLKDQQATISQIVKSINETAIDNS